jgi:hypothetical protein
MTDSQPEQPASWRASREPGWHQDIGYQLQDVLRAHQYSRSSSRPDDPGWLACSCGHWQGYWCDFHPHVADELRVVVAELEALRRRELLTTELGQLAEELSWAAKVAGTAAHQTLPVPTRYSYLQKLESPGERSIDALRRFVGMFADEIATVHKAHVALTAPGWPEAMHASTLSSAVEVGRRLVGLVRRLSEETATHAQT